jgi:hypothetical protein
LLTFSTAKAKPCHSPIGRGVGNKSQFRLGLLGRAGDEAETQPIRQGTERARWQSEVFFLGAEAVAFEPELVFVGNA